LWVAFQLELSKAGESHSAVRAGFRMEQDQWSWLDDLRGRAEAVTVTNDQLVLGFQDGPIRRYDRTEPTRGYSLRKLPKPYKLRLLACDVSQKRLLALAGRDLSPAATSIPATGPAGDYTIFEYRQGRWSALADLPEPVAAVGAVRLVAHTRSVDVMARTGPREFVRWTRQEDRWRRPGTFELDEPVDRYWLAGSLTGTELIMVTARQQQSGVIFRLFELDSESKLTEIGELTCPENPPLGAARTDVAFAADGILLGWLTEKHEALLARFDHSGNSIGKVEQLPVTSRPQRPQEPQLLTLLLIAALVLFLFFSRAFRPTAGPALPENLVLADYWRRMAAAAIDFSPFVFLAMVIWAGDLQKMIQPGGSFFDTLTRTLEDPDPKLAYINLYVVCAYAAYCTITELIWLATPGKIMLGMHVSSARAPEEGVSPIRIIIRNALKILELSYPLFLVAMFFTNQRQRLGDLAARTIVVQAAGPTGDKPKDE